MRLATRLGIGLILHGILVPATCLAHELFVVCQDDASLVRIDTSRETVTARIGIAPGPAMITATRDGRTLFITHPESGLVTKLDAVDLGAPRIFTPGGTPFGIAVDPVGRFIYVGDWKKNVVRKLDGLTGATLKRLRWEESPRLWRWTRRALGYMSRIAKVAPSASSKPDRCAL